MSAYKEDGSLLGEAYALPQTKEEFKRLFSYFLKLYKKTNEEYQQFFEVLTFKEQEAYLKYFHKLNDEIVKLREYGTGKFGISEEKLMQLELQALQDEEKIKYHEHAERLRAVS
jgi:hypothetical protein